MSYQQQQQRRRFVPPEVGSIHRAKVSRIESYGCFVKIISGDGSSPGISGLVHISQLTSITNNGVKISDVNDVVSIDDLVYVKVMDVSVEQTEDGRQRHKFKLSMKYVHQDTGQDLDPDGELMEQDLMRSQHNRSGGGGGNTQNFDQDGTGGANSLLGRSLASNIGMSSAIDPGSLILKGKSASVGAMGNTKFNGYSLVGEDEGEDEAPMKHDTTVAANMPNAAPTAAVRPMGRGRATTLPAWMTRQDDDRLGSMKDEKGPGDNDDDEDGSSRDGHRRKKKSSRRRDRHKDRKRSSSRKHSRKHKKSSRHRSRSRGRSRSESYSYYSSSDDYSRSRSRSPSYKKKRKKSKHKHRRHREDYSRSRNRSRSDSQDFDGQGRGAASPPSAFSNVEEARAIMERLERRQRER